MGMNYSDVIWRSSWNKRSQPNDFILPTDVVLLQKEGSELILVVRIDFCPLLVLVELWMPNRLLIRPIHLLVPFSIYVSSMSSIIKS